ncbi:MAG: hypothetical protein ABI165_13025 [Bryobacteraceae bacterium]
MGRLGAVLFAGGFNLGIDLAHGNFAETGAARVFTQELAGNREIAERGLGWPALFVLFKAAQAFAEDLAHGPALLFRQAPGDLELRGRKRDGNGFGVSHGYYSLRLNPAISLTIALRDGWSSGTEWIGKRISEPNA